MLRERIERIIEEAIRGAVEGGKLSLSGTPECTVEVPPDVSFGDFSTNAAMVWAKEAKMAPRQIAEILKLHIEKAPEVAKVEIAGPGFVNVFCEPAAIAEVVTAIRGEGEDFGRRDWGGGRRVQVEFVSANPTGPVTIANGWGGVIGDVLSSTLEWTGHSVEREYYVNDADNSTQLVNFAKGLVARYLQELGHDVPFPEKGYPGEYVRDVAKEIITEHGDKFVEADPEERLRAFTKMGLERMVAMHKADLEAFGIKFDVWFVESSLFESGKYDETMAELSRRGNSYESEGAIWLRSTAFGDEKDRVLVRSTGAAGYLAGDIAYHRDKFQRGFDLVINVWGANTQGHILPTKCGLAALGYDPDRMEVVLHQMVRVVREGKVVPMGKRMGTFITLSEVVDEVGKDAVRYLFLLRGPDAPLDFDLDLAKKQSNENPVYYVQYAHARIHSILRTATERKVAPPAADVDLSPLTDAAELRLIRKLDDLPHVVSESARNREPHRLTRYASEVATDFHSFYTVCRVLGDDPKVTAARLALCDAARIVLANVLTILGVSAPERM